MNIVLLGCPGAGKGTLAKQLQKEHSFYILSPGDLYRKEANLKTEFGLKAKAYWGGGNLCPEEMTNELVQNTLKGLPGMSIIFDGYPRTLPQSQFLDTISLVQLVFDLHIEDDVSVARLLRRREIENRPDDTEEIIRQRLKVYHSNNDAILNYYINDIKRYRLIDSNKSKQDVFDEVQQIIIQKCKEIDNENR
jgi:adenylate kinase